MNNSNLLAKEIIDVSQALSKDFQAAYLQLSETPLHNNNNDTKITTAEYEDYLETISLQLVELRHSD